MTKGSSAWRTFFFFCRFPYLFLSFPKSLHLQPSSWLSRCWGKGGIIERENVTVPFYLFFHIYSYSCSFTHSFIYAFIYLFHLFTAETKMRFRSGRWLAESNTSESAAEFQTIIISYCQLSNNYHNQPVKPIIINSNLSSASAQIWKKTRLFFFLYLPFLPKKWPFGRIIPQSRWHSLTVRINLQRLLTRE